MEIKNIFNQSLKLVLECGEILKNVDYEKEATAKKDGSLVTKYDLMIDQKLTKGLKEIANYPVFSEEHSEEISDSYFIIDPIDGTHNFNSGLEYFGILVAFIQNNQTQFSIVHMPQLNKTYTAIKGEGAFLNQTKKLCVRKPSTKLIGACDITKDSIDDIKKILLNNNNVDIRSLYCTGVELCYIANGCMDFLFLKNSAFEWDFIGPKLILEEAGGILECIKQPNGSFNIIAGSKEAVQQVKNIININ